jgi:hypothetical protein
MCFFDLCCKPDENNTKQYWDNDLNGISEQFALIRANTDQKLKKLEKNKIKNIDPHSKEYYEIKQNL